ncbi:TRM11 family methyltransferase [Lentimicrobium sp. S6]|uniref:TRM11 family SAM-dependent methyltransferase n=1 Tax=Lentimicrobium sp. S6 TaxID=2735872 RepID=UPI0015537B9F|nr:SAM-dependent methyltransferase [Lentimicrobium sp. S6]NPD46895.1 SAM-dependent methyltransferase [Lentimicrobium sp. S6]
MQDHKYLYSYNYDRSESDLCKLESRHLFNEDEKNKLLFSDIKIEPSNSAFIKRRIDIISSSDDYDTLILKAKKEKIRIDSFKAEYVVLHGDKTEYQERLSKLKDIGFCIDGAPDYYNPYITYALAYYEGIWYFGVLIKNNFKWHQHNDKPYSYSNSLGLHTAKSLVNIASKGNKEITLLDACCGAGTIILEACFAGYHIEGCDINPKIFHHAGKNISHFNYTANIYCSDIKDISKKYDAAIIDLPYNMYSRATDDELFNIIDSTAKITNRMVILSTEDITNLISKARLKIVDHGSVSKIGKAHFVRNIWVCEVLGKV